jgi:hypothetical protein
VQNQPKNGLRGVHTKSLPSSSSSSSSSSTGYYTRGKDRPESWPLSIGPPKSLPNDQSHWNDFPRGQTTYPNLMAAISYSAIFWRSPKCQNSIWRLEKVESLPYLTYLAITYHLRRAPNTCRDCQECQNEFDILSFDILSFDILSFDILSFDILSFDI